MARFQDMAPVRQPRTLRHWALWASVVVAVGLSGAVGFFQHQPRTGVLSSGSAEGFARSVGDAVGTQAAAAGANNQLPVSKTKRATVPLVALASKPAASIPALRWPMWEFQIRQPIPAREPPLTPPTWRLLGATGSGGTWKLIILRQGKPVPEFYSTGDSLPGGYVIGRITEEDVTLIQGKRAILLSYIGI